MKLSMGIVGLPNVGKSTLFNALTQKAVPAENYPFCTIDPSVGVVAVPDDRLDQLAKLSASVKVLPPAMEFVDIAGLVEGASKGEGLGNQFLAHIREVDAIVQMVRIFAVADGKSETINHVYGEINPLRDIKVINMELILADLETVTKRIDRISREVKRGDKDAVAEMAVLEKLQSALEAEHMAYEVDLNKDETKIAKSLHLLTRKKMLYALNRRTDGMNMDATDPEAFAALTAHIEATGASWVIVDAKTEHELSAFEGEERSMMRGEVTDHEGDGVDDLIRSSYALLGLMTYFTTGPEETRGWTISVGSTAPEAGAAIHTDFQERFIRADVIPWDALISAGGTAQAREKGLLRTEGKEYIVQDGDVIEFKIGA